MNNERNKTEAPIRFNNGGLVTLVGVVGHKNSTDEDPSSYFEALN